MLRRAKPMNVDTDLSTVAMRPTIPTKLAEQSLRTRPAQHNVFPGSILHDFDSLQDSGSAARLKKM